MGKVVARWSAIGKGNYSYVTVQAGGMKKQLSDGQVDAGVPVEEYIDVCRYALELGGGSPQ
jgi:hypothetical protein